jgi:DNA-binding transcriptional LysR family regulator
MKRSSPLRDRVHRLSILYVYNVYTALFYPALPDLIRRFRAVVPGLEIRRVEIVSLDQIAALKGRRIDVGFGRRRSDAPAGRRDVLREERLGVAMPLSQDLLQSFRQPQWVASRTGP